MIEFENVSKSFGDRLLIDDLSFKVPAGAIVGIIGPNGAGKSTLFRMIAGKEKPDSGNVKIGPTAKMAFVDQSREALENDKTVWQDVSGGLDNLVVGKFAMPIARLPRPLQLQGQRPAEARRQPLGRRARAAAPGQDADRRRQRADARRAVERPRRRDPARARGRAARVRRLVMVISHDRWFLDRIATHILAAEGDSKWIFFDGNYQEYEADKKKRLGEEGAKPKRLRFRPMQH